MSEKRNSKDILGLDSLDTDDTLSILADFPELSKVVEVDGKMIVTEDDDEPATDLEDFPGGTVHRKCRKMSDETLIKYLEGLELSAELSFPLILVNSGLDGVERVRECLNSQERLLKLEPEIVPLFAITQIIDVVESELESRGYLKEFRESHPFMHYIEGQLVIYDHYHDRMVDLLAMFAANYIGDETILYLVDSLSHNMHASIDKAKEDEEGVAGKIKDDVKPENIVIE